MRCEQLKAAGQIPDADATWVPQSLLDSLGITPERIERQQMADGRVLERDIGFAFVHIGDNATVDDVVFAEPTDTMILGARSLEGLNLRVDPRARKLVSGGRIITAVAWSPARPYYLAQ